jgi:hypothetical protein
MKNYFRWKLDNFKNVIKFTEEHPNEIAAVTEMDDDVVNLKDAITEIAVAEGVQDMNIEGITEEAKKKKKTMADVVITFARKGLAMARKTKNKDMEEKVDYRVSYISRAPKADSLSRAKDIKLVLGSNSGVFSNIKPADLTMMDDAIKAYELAANNPKLALEHKKTEGTKALEEPYKKGNDSCDNIFDLFYGNYQLTKPLLVEELADLLGIEMEGVRHNGITALCVDGNPPADAITHLLEGVQLKLVELNLIAHSNIYGLAGLLKFKHGTYHLEFSKPGFVTKQMIVFVKRGTTVELEVEMMRVV